MVSVHEALGVAVIVVCFAAAVLGALAYRRKRGAGAIVAHALVLAQTVLIAQAALGLLLVSGDHRAPDRLHYAYGAFALGVVLSPWFYAPAEGPKRLLWFAGTTFLAGALAVRAFMTGT
jgi:heme A synthase